MVTGILTFQPSHVLYGSEADAGDIEAADRKLECKRLVEGRIRRPLYDFRFLRLNDFVLL